MCGMLILLFKRMILHLVYRTASFVKVSVEPLPEALDIIRKVWETGQGPLITQGGSCSAALHFVRREVEKCECKNIKCLNSELEN